jgi:hypothetical protein
MKTTVELPDELLIAAKKRAAELRQPLRKLIEESLRRDLGRTRRGSGSGRKKFRWITSKGGLPPGLDLSNRQAMHDWLMRQP